METEEEMKTKTLSKPIFVKSQSDKVLLSERVLHNLLLSECHYDNKCSDYMTQVQKHILVNHRKIVTDWMLEVCQESHLASQVKRIQNEFKDLVMKNDILRCS